MRRKLTIVTAAALMSALMTGPAAAHTIKVEHPQTGEQIRTHRAERFDWANEGLGGGWVGGPVGLPGQGKGLVLGGPDGDQPMTPAHAGGLNTACYSLQGDDEEGGPSAVDIRGPGPSCPHGQ